MVTFGTLVWQSLVFALIALVLAWTAGGAAGVRRALAVIEDVLAGLFLVAGLLVVFVSVVMRYVFNNPPGWADEFARIFVAWGAMFGFSVALREGRHITVDLLFSALPPRGKRVLALLASLIGVAFTSFIAVAGGHYVAFLRKIGLRSIYTDLPEWLLQLIIPLGFGVFALQFARNFLDLWTGRTQVHEEVTGV
ncbi:TRAP transporter small permease [Marinithermus hydrothermalis]|uniref:Tripartite ATP-independent periplasmic transporter DctQ component n=1 Tax=Marinithermus hydrothermalis (strain DSM 14884 / JCM 11576 / T1) TaxID=869210 RepID=F2NPW8_MARHT|nr:TRAP transporter small permease [Marinithermus hydrothermalis]AEB11069.1 Tripartite ATP-independent periplasmic transporter DctQ component [Marinithermus hydrothermalis DSM 14884]